MIIDGTEVHGKPVTIVKLSCGNVQFEQGHGYQVNAPIECEAGAEGDCRTYDAIGCTIAEVFETETMDVVDKTAEALAELLS